jgi:phosphoglucosamine mutase
MTENVQLFGTSGIRRIFNQDLVQLVYKVGLAIGTQYTNVIVGRDTRTSGSALAHSVIAGILTAGASCSDAGILPTPTLAFITREFKAGVMITASHNPPQYNGIKLLNPDGSAFSADQQRRIEDFVNGTATINIQWDKIQSSKLYKTAIKKHVACIIQDFPERFKLKVVVDSGCGAANFITPYLLNEMGCEVDPLYCYPSGIFPRDAEPIETNLSDLMRTVKETEADLGIAHDGDADRMMAVDDLGRFISGDKLLALLAQASGAKRIVTTVDASMSIEKIYPEVIRTKVGDPYVSEELKNGGGFGGEPSGAWVFPQVSLCPDGIYAAAQITAIANRQKLSKLIDSIPSYSVIRGSIASNGTKMAVLKQKLLAELNPTSSDTVDGIKLNFKDGWLLIRPSGTEPKIRLTAEAENESVARQRFEDSSRIIGECSRV